MRLVPARCRGGATSMCAPGLRAIAAHASTARAQGYPGDGGPSPRAAHDPSLVGSARSVSRIGRSRPRVMVQTTGSRLKGKIAERW